MIMELFLFESPACRQQNNEVKPFNPYGAM